MNRSTLSQRRTASKSTASAITWRKGLRFSGLNWYGDSTRLAMSMYSPSGVQLAAAAPNSAPNMPPFIGFSRADAPTLDQKASNASRAAVRPPAINPAAMTTALIAPALAPLMPAISRRSSSSSRSSTPQVKAPCAPPPCRARSTCLRGRADRRAVLMDNVAGQSDHSGRRTGGCGDGWRPDALHRQQELLVVVDAPVGADAPGRHRLRRSHDPVRFVRARFGVQAAPVRGHADRQGAGVAGGDRRQAAGDLGHAGHRRVPRRAFPRIAPVAG